MDNKEAMILAHRAKSILEDELVKNTLDAIESSIVGQWKELGIESHAQAQELKRLLWAAQQFRRSFEVLVAGGAIAQNELLLESNMKIKHEAAMERIRQYG